MVVGGVSHFETKEIGIFPQISAGLESLFAAGLSAPCVGFSRL